MSQTTSIFANPGKNVTIAVQVLDGYGRSDGYGSPVVDWVRFPSGLMAADFPQAMTRIEQGVYAYTLSIPSGMSSVGTFIVSASYSDPLDQSLTKFELFLINVALPFGNSSVSPA
jgi:hypothetical protein